MGPESEGEEHCSKVNLMEIDAEKVPAPIKFSCNTSYAVLPSRLLTNNSAVHRRHEATARLMATRKKDIPTLAPRTKWIGDANDGALPIATDTSKLSDKSKTSGLHVLDLFSGFSCGGLRTVLEAGYLVSCYTTVEIDDISRMMANKTISDLQEEYPGQLPDKAIRGHNKRLPQNISLVGESDLSTLILNKGPIDFICGGWECQSMSMAGKHKGMDDDRFTPFLDMVRTLNFLQKNQISPPLYLFENTYPGTPGQYPRVDEAAKMVESFLGAPVVIDAAGLGSVAHRVRLFWTNWCLPEQLQDAIPQNLPPTPSLAAILHPDHVPTVPGHDPIYPFAKLNKVGKPRKCMPTIVSFPRSHAYRKKDNGLPGEGQLWNKRMKRWDEPSLMEREQMMGYKPDATYAGLATIAERAERLGRAMDANTMRWLGAFLHATQIDTDTTSSIPNSSLGGGILNQKKY